MNFIPLYDKVVIKIDEPRSQTASGLFLPDGSQDPHILATVQAVGHGFSEGGNWVTLKTQVGDRVLVIRGNYREITIDGSKYQLLQEKDILGIL